MSVPVLGWSCGEGCIVLFVLGPGSTKGLMAQVPSLISSTHLHSEVFSLAVLSAGLGLGLEFWLCCVLGLGWSCREESAAVLFMAWPSLGQTVDGPRY